MLSQFLASWPLFQQAYMTAWLSAMLLALLGVLAVARDQIFLGAAVSQAATLGIAVALVLRKWSTGFLGTWWQSDAALATAAMGFAVLATLLSTQQPRPGDLSAEARTGWVFLGSASCTMLLVAHSPHGLAEIQRLLSSSLIGATRTDVRIFAGCLLGAVLGFSLGWQRILLLIMDPALAPATGMRVSRWSLGLSISLGLVVGLSIRATGLLYTFGCLVLPALVAKHLCREVRPLFLVAPSVALGTSVLACVLAEATDSPPAQMTVALLWLLTGLTWCLRRLRGRQ
ncbi:MAG: metal ABC transporter permease [Candidatus Tectimicrobiota bacterium]